MGNETQTLIFILRKSKDRMTVMLKNVDQILNWTFRSPKELKVFLFHISRSFQEVQIYEIFNFKSILTGLNWFNIVHGSLW